MKKASVIGSGFAGLSTGSFLAKNGYDVTIYEKNQQVGGRARSFTESGFTFDMGPSWYWMPDVFERFYNQFGHTTSDFYDLKRLDPSYRVIFSATESVDIPTGKEDLMSLFESIEPGTGAKLNKFLKEAAYKYDVGVKNLVYKPSLSITEFMRWDVLKGMFRLQLLNSIADHIRKDFKDPKLRSILEFPSLFLGATPENTPALYSLMNYADLELGTWYPMGGMVQIVKAMEKIALEQGVSIETAANVSSIEVENSFAKSMLVNGNSVSSDYIVSAADYHHTETMLLEKKYQSFTPRYWDKRVLAPSALIYYLGIDKKVDGLLHHNLFFDEDFPNHAAELYDNPQWPAKPLFYACAPSKTDPHVAPEGKENIFILIPVAPNLKDSDEVKDKYLDIVLGRMESYLKTDIKNHIIYKRSYSISNFKQDYNSFKGNAYGLANTLTQTAFLKPPMRSKKVKNLLYAGQLTVPGPGVPPALISGEVTANYIKKKFAA